MTDTRVGPTGQLVEEDGRRWYRIDDVDRMPPFLVAVVSDDDLWMFASSAGPLTAGRVSADRAFLPYETDDRLHQAVGRSGPVTVLARGEGDAREVWRPFAARIEDGCRRALAKDEIGTALRYEEVNERWGLRVRATWAPSPAHGWVRTVELLDTGGGGHDLELVDGLLDVMPSGVPAATEQSTSNLVDAYKRAEAGPWGTVSVHSLESLITDRAEPAETLSATVLWTTGLDGATVHLDERTVEELVDGRGSTAEQLRTGQRNAYLLRGRVEVPSGGSTTWQQVVDVGLGHAAVHDVIALVGTADAREQVDADVRSGHERFDGLLSQADGRQTTGDPVADAHHLSNVLFNCMRGGVFPHGVELPVDDLVAFVADRNVGVHARHGDGLAAHGEWVGLDDLRRWAEEQQDPDLLRLVLEYLPVAFSRRHGDPSRPWNRFEVRVRDDDGQQVLAYEGNWRDIFQNWEALLRSWPRFVPHVVAKFVNASTLDGHNPYRISRDGIDWEVPDPDDPWSNIGYWGDHQVVYLHRLLLLWERVDPDGPAAWLDRAVFTYADVPYTIADHAAMLQDPRDTIAFDEERAGRVAARVDEVGADGRLVVAPDGALARVTLAEKLLVTALAKLSAYVPGGGIWMNTQRPEWNDANNALAGWGLSMVTLYQLDQYVAWLRRLLVGRPDLALSAPVAGWVGALREVYEEVDAERAVQDDAVRREVLDRVGRAGTAHRQGLQDGFDPAPRQVAVDDVLALLDAARAHLAASIAASRRDDGLYESYNLLQLDDGVAAVEHLEPMLEGQVAVLGADALDGEQALAVVEALWASPLHREDLGTFMLYPATVPPSFVGRNELPASALERAPALRDLVGEGDGALVQRDADGGLHFRPGLPNAGALRDALGRHGVDGPAREEVVAVYEELFDHHGFTGRSSGMHGYEGIGSVYWHMVSKLLLAVQERHRAETGAGTDQQVVDGLRAAYLRVRDGLGSRHDPATFGAVPTDCYSHTPAHAGAQQPGMTGQVKEEVIARLGELGLVLEGGRLHVVPPLLPGRELLGDGDGYACTVCATPVAVRAGSTDEVVVTTADGVEHRGDGTSLSRAHSDALLGRTGEVERVDVTASWLGRGG